MGDPLQQRRTPHVLAASGQVIEISEKIGNFRQLAEIVAADLDALGPDKPSSDWRDREVSGRLSFGFADAQASVPALTGRVAATIDAVCQRCLAPFALPLRPEFALVFAEEQAAAAAGEEYEAWELEGDELCPAEVVEEILIMSIPFAPMHDNDAGCIATDSGPDAAGELITPFANLKAQMERAKKIQ